MKSLAYLIIPLSLVAFTLPAVAQKKQAAAKPPAEIVVANTRAANLTGFTLADDAGKIIADIKQWLAGGKSARVRIPKGAPCVLTLSAMFDDEAENSASQVDICKDKTLRFTD